MIGDFNYKEVEWENMEAGPNKETWGARLMNYEIHDYTTRH